MGKIGKAYPGLGGRVHQYSPSALARFDRPFTDLEHRAMRHQITAALVGLLILLGFFGWIMTA
jgi:hypothetical protein